MHMHTHSYTNISNNNCDTFTGDLFTLWVKWNEAAFNNNKSNNCLYLVFSHITHLFDISDNVSFYYIVYLNGI